MDQPTESLTPWIDESLEARLVAFVLGEASDFEREELERLMEQRPELEVFKEQIEAVHRQLAEIGLGESGGAGPAIDGEPDVEWKLDSKRRAELLSILSQPPVPSEHGPVAIITPADAEVVSAAADAVQKLEKHSSARFFKALSWAAAACILAGAGALTILMISGAGHKNEFVAMNNELHAGSSEPSVSRAEFDAEYGVSPAFGNARADTEDGYFYGTAGVEHSRRLSKVKSDADGDSMPADKLMADYDDFDDDGVVGNRNWAAAAPGGFGDAGGLPVENESRAAAASGSYRGSGAPAPEESTPSPATGVTSLAAMESPDSLAEVELERQVVDLREEREILERKPGNRGAPPQPAKPRPPATARPTAPTVAATPMPAEPMEEAAEALLGPAPAAAEPDPAPEPEPEPAAERKSRDFRLNLPADSPEPSSAPAPAKNESLKFAEDVNGGAVTVQPAGSVSGSGKASDRGRERDSRRGKEMLAPVTDPADLANAEGAKNNRSLDRPMAGEKARFGLEDREMAEGEEESLRAGIAGRAAGLTGESEVEFKKMAKGERTPGEIAVDVTDGKYRVNGREITADELGQKLGMVEGQMPDQAITLSINGIQRDSSIGEVMRRLDTAGDDVSRFQRGFVGDQSGQPEFQQAQQQAEVRFPEILAANEPFSTFSLNVSDVSFKLVYAALMNGQSPDKAKIRIEDFVNAFDYGDPLPGASERIACQHEQAVHPFLPGRNLLRISIRTGAAGRAAQTPLRLTLLLDLSGSMERADRRETIQRAFALLAQQLLPQDQITLIGFAREPRLLADRVAGQQAGQELGKLIAQTAPDGGTNLEAALKLAFAKAEEQKLEGAQNRIVLITDGAANLGDADPDSLAEIVERMRLSGIAFDAAGVGADGANDDILEALTRNGDGRYYFLNRPEDADDGFAKQIAGALRPSATDVKLQVYFNPKRVGRYKLLGFEKHRLTKEEFRDDSVDAAEMAAAEAGVALFQIEPLPGGEGDIGHVSVRFGDAAVEGTIEEKWPIPYEPTTAPILKSEDSIRLATAAALFAAKLKDDPVGQSAEYGELAKIVNSLPENIRGSERVQQLLMMIEQTRRLTGED